MTQEELLRLKAKGIPDSQWGKLAEGVILDTLPDSVAVRGFDVLWGEVKIEVRTSVTEATLDRWRFRTVPNHGADVLIGIVPEEGKLHYWVVPVNDIKAGTINLGKDSPYYTKFEDLPARILTVEKNDGTNKDMHKTVVYLDKPDYLQLKAKLAIEDTNYSDWIRGLIKDSIRK